MANGNGNGNGGGPATANQVRIGSVAIIMIGAALGYMSSRNLATAKRVEDALDRVQQIANENKAAIAAIQASRYTASMAVAAQRREADNNLLIWQRIAELAETTKTNTATIKSIQDRLLTVGDARGQREQP